MQILLNSLIPIQRYKVVVRCFYQYFINNSAPLEKIISTQNLSYIPNLYFRKYKLIESLNHERFDFPEQKILLPRSKTSWDAVLCQMKQKAELRKEIQKYKIAQNYHVAKTAKQEFIKKELKKEQRQLFHRIIANQLAQDVKDYFKKNTEVVPNEEMQDQKQAQPPKAKNSLHQGRGMDDIFIDKHLDEDYLDIDDNGDIDFFDDILNDGVPPKSPLQLINAQSKVIQEQPAPKRTTKDYVDNLNRLNERLSANAMEEEDYLSTQTHINRRACLKKINENLRRRLKSKGAETEDRSLTSATVALSNLINNYPECKDTDNFIDIPSETDWIFDDSVRNKKRRDEDFQLNWDPQEIQKFEEMNDKFQIEKLKDAPSILQLTIDKTEYPKVFQRNIATNYNFPSNIESIRNFSANFQKKKVYYNQFFDQAYQKFIRKNNKRKLLQKFEKNSSHMFAEHYVQEEIGSDEKISVGKMFLYSPNKIADRLIYKVTPGTSKISIIAKQYSKKNVPLSREKIILLSFLVNRYLTQFGNNWKTITEFIEIFPCFSNYLIKPELVQELYQMINRHQLKINHLENLEIWDKKFLPASQLYNGSYKDFQTVVKQKKFAKKPFNDNQMIDESSLTQDQQSEETNNFSLDNFQSYLKQPLHSKTEKKPVFTNLSKKYKQYGSTLNAKTTNDIYNFYENKVRKANKIIQEYRNTYVVTKVDASDRIQNEEKVLEYVQNNLKGEVKNGIPFRKKKNINERNNELVKILQALRSKSSGNLPNPATQKSLPQSVKPPTGQPKPNPTLPPNTTNVVPPQPMAPKPTTEVPSQKQQKKTKTPQKRVSGAVAPIKKQKKKDGEDEKDKK